MKSVDKGDEEEDDDKIFDWFKAGDKGEGKVWLVIWDEIEIFDWFEAGDIGGDEEWLVIWDWIDICDKFEECNEFKLFGAWDEISLSGEAVSKFGIKSVGIVVLFSEISDCSKSNIRDRNSEILVHFVGLEMCVDKLE